MILWVDFATLILYFTSQLTWSTTVSVSNINPILCTLLLPSGADFTSSLLVCARGFFLSISNNCMILCSFICRMLGYVFKSLYLELEGAGILEMNFLSNFCFCFHYFWWYFFTINHVYRSEILKRFHHFNSCQHFKYISYWKMISVCRHDHYLTTLDSYTTRSELEVS